jgi:uncharacterized protein (TIGR02145 family)
MKKTITLAALLISAISFSQVGIGTTSPNSKSILDLTSTTKGFLFPRMTYAEKTAILSPPTGLQIWCTDCGATGELQFFDGTIWVTYNPIAGSFPRPGSPTGPVATALYTKASVAFTAPASDGGSPIILYKVTSSPGGFTASGATSPLVVTGLTNGTSYTFTVVSTNISVNSLDSEASAPVVPNCGAYTTTGTFLLFQCYNLGATITGDPMTYQAGAINGDLYQWGRKTDGHEKRSSAAIATQATNNAATLPIGVSSKFIKTFTDWITPSTDTLWGDGTTGVNPVKAANDPCPSGFKVPSVSQWGSIFRGNIVGGIPSAAIANIWSWTGAGYTVGTSLYLPAAGYRDTGDGTLVGVGGQLGFGHYWSSTVSTSQNAYYLQIYSSNVNFSYNYRGRGFSVRCVSE